MEIKRQNHTTIYTGTPEEIKRCKRFLQRIRALLQHRNIHVFPLAMSGPLVGILSHWIIFTFNILPGGK